MAYIVNTKIENQTNQYLLDAKNVKGSYVVVNSIKERDELPAATTVTGSLCYCTADSKFYQYNGSIWIEKEFGTAGGVGNTDIAEKANKIQVNLADGSKPYATITISSNEPTNGNRGDIWFKY